MNLIAKLCINTILFFVFMLLIIKGHSRQTIVNLFYMLVGLSGLIGMLWMYNRNHK